MHVLLSPHENEPPPPNRVFLCSSYNGHLWLNDLWKFDIESKRWTCIQESTDAVVVGGGDGEQGANPNVDVGGAAAAAANGPAPPAGGALVAEQGAGNNRRAGQGVRGKVPSRRFGYVSVVHEGKLVLWGGFDGTRWLNDMFEFDFATKTWTEIQAKGAFPTARSCPAWAKDDTHVYIQGKPTATHKHPSIFWNIENENLTLFDRTHVMRLCVSQKNSGGYDGVERKADFFACNLATYTWTEMPCLGTPPSPR